MPKNRVDRVTISFQIGGEDLEKLQLFANENGYSSLNIAARALIFGSITDYPKWGISKVLVGSIAFEMRQRYMMAIHDNLWNVAHQIEQDMAALAFGKPEEGV